MWGYYTRAALGNTLYPSWLQNPPRINLSPLPVDEQSVVSMQHATNLIITLSDPDAPSRSDPKWSEFCHWIAYDVPLPEASPSDPMLTPIDLVSYKPPGPPVGTGKHRYVFIAFAPKNGTDKPLTLSVPFDRKHWGWGQSRVGVQKWAKENGLFPVGKSAMQKLLNRFEVMLTLRKAANFVYAQNEHY